MVTMFMPHRVLGVKLEPDKDACSGNKGDDIDQFPVRSGTLCSSAEFIAMSGNPVAHIRRMHYTVSSKDRCPRHSVVEYAHISPAGFCDRAAPAVH